MQYWTFCRDTARPAPLPAFTVKSAELPASYDASAALTGALIEAAGRAIVADYHRSPLHIRRWIDCRLSPRRFRAYIAHARLLPRIYDDITPLSITSQTTG